MNKEDPDELKLHIIKDLMRTLQLRFLRSKDAEKMEYRITVFRATVDFLIFNGVAMGINKETMSEFIFGDGFKEYFLEYAELTKSEIKKAVEENNRGKHGK